MLTVDKYFFWSKFSQQWDSGNYPITFSVSGYGLTECSPVACALERGSTKYMSSGKPVPNTEMKIMNMDTKMNLGPREVGEVCVRGPQVRHCDSWMF